MTDAEKNQVIAENPNLYLNEDNWSPHLYPSGLEQCFRIVEEMRKTNKPCFQLTGDSCGNFIAEFSNYIGDKVLKMASNPCLAIRDAALAALNGEEE